MLKTTKKREEIGGLVSRSKEEIKKEKRKTSPFGWLDYTRRKMRPINPAINAQDY